MFRPPQFQLTGDGRLAIIHEATEGELRSARIAAFAPHRRATNAVSET